MPEVSLEEVIQESEFSALVSEAAQSFFRLSRTLLKIRAARWGKTHFYQLVKEASELESFLDDYGAANNRTYQYLRELVASVRWFATSGLSAAHLSGRWASYGLDEEMGSDVLVHGQRDLVGVHVFLCKTCERLLSALEDEAQALDVQLPAEALPEHRLAEARTRRRLPRNAGEEELVDEEQKIAEVASKFVSACEMLGAVGVRVIEDASRRHEFLARHCREEQARVYEATVHNLQSTYDTYIKKTVIESRDGRLKKLRGCSSVALHLLEGVTFLTHFVERHESGLRSDQAEERIRKLVNRAEVEEVILNKLLYWADLVMRTGRKLAEDLLPSYTNVQELEAELPEGLKLHARPASLIVSIVHRYGTPVELSVKGQSCNAGSILELLVAVGSHPDARVFSFRGDENPLRDIALLFEHGLGENGLDQLPDELAYLRNN